MLIFHGTTKSRARNIMLGKDKDSTNQIWTVSNPDCMYFWADPENDPDQTDEEKQQLCLHRALESAIITAAASETLDTSLAIITYEIDKECTDIYADCSCQNMEGALEIPFRDLDRNRLCFYEIPDVYIPEMALFYLLPIIRQDWLILPKHMQTRIASIQNHNRAVNDIISATDEILFDNIYDTELSGMIPLQTT